MKTRREKNRIAHVGLNKLISDAGRLQLKVGYFENNYYPVEYSRSGKLVRKSIPVAQAAAINEFGVPERNIPQRSFLRTAVSKYQGKWANTSEMLSKRILDGKSTAKAALDLLGFDAIADIQQQIKDTNEPPLSKVTIAKRRSKYASGKTSAALEKPLIDSGIMFKTISHKVE